MATPPHPGFPMGTSSKTHETSPFHPASDLASATRSLLPWAECRPHHRLAGSHQIQADNADPNLASSWDTLPGAADIAQWEFTVTAANSPVLGADLSWAASKSSIPAAW